MKKTACILTACAVLLLGTPNLLPCSAPAFADTESDSSFTLKQVYTLLRELSKNYYFYVTLESDAVYVCCHGDDVETYQSVVGSFLQENGISADMVAYLPLVDKTESITAWTLDPILCATYERQLKQYVNFGSDITYASADRIKPSFGMTDDYRFFPMDDADSRYISGWDFDVFCGGAVIIKDTSRMQELGLLPMEADALNQFAARGLDYGLTVNADLEMPDNIPTDSLYFVPESAMILVLNEPGTELVGLVTAQYHYARMEFWPNPDWPIWIEPAEGCTVDAAALNTEEYRYLTPAGFQTNRWTAKGLSSDQDQSDTLAQAIAFCEQLSAREDIAFAWPIGMATIPEIDNTCIAHWNVVPFAGDGDLNGDGKDTVADAVLMARVVAEDPNAPLDDPDGNHLDFNADGIFDAQDTVDLLRYLAGDVS